MQGLVDKVKNLLTTIVSRYGYAKPAIASAALLYAFYRIAEQHGLLPKKNLTGEVVFITGAARGIGRQLAFRLARLGAKVVVSDVNVEEGNKVAANIQAERRLAMFVECDVTRPESVAQAAAAVRAKFGPPTILINNAGIVSGKKLLDVSSADMELTMRVNTISHMHTVKEFLPSMIENDHGHIVTIASMAGLSGHAGLVDYCASKFAAVGFDEALRRELLAKKSHVKTTCICPYYINTGMFQGVTTRNWLIPMLDEGYAANRIISGIRQNEAVVVMPWRCNIVYYLKALLPISCVDWVYGVTGIDSAMESFVGRKPAVTK
mmetsp:Transcript_9490/g.18326  ORF Transcript_9490/g.18326 Transcript_9490/m.18326 type:complete len:321 (+) Transcript_9490:2220-3182(+)